MGLMGLCGTVLSLDSARTALGVTEDSQMLLALTVAAVSCQMAWRDLGTSRRHLATAAGHQRDMAQRLHDRAQQVAAARASAKATTATNEVTADVLGQLEEVTRALGRLVDAVTRDREVTPWGTRGQGFRNTALALKDIIKCLARWREGHEEVMWKLEAAHRVLVGPGEGQAGDVGVALSPLGHGDTLKDIGDLGHTPVSFPWGPPGLPDIPCPVLGHHNVPDVPQCPKQDPSVP
ncbi:uncharacterized protein LOC134432798 [Melospiza melodia melodia]|uniref:uncharacterized protein LOC134432798 n=1 Tax=Melospiza melodia melodia TaxID=1914991 RepID=UPI002FD09D18